MRQEKEEYSESETPDSKRSRTDQCENESASDAQESGSDLEPENELEPELEPESSSVQTSSTTESSSRRGKRKQACKCIPIHTADVERTFSQLKLVKTKIRNRNDTGLFTTHCNRRPCY